MLSLGMQAAGRSSGNLQAALNEDEIKIYCESQTLDTFPEFSGHLFALLSSASLKFGATELLGQEFQFLLLQQHFRKILCGSNLEYFCERGCLYLQP